MATEMGLSRDQLASVEIKRVPLRFWSGWRACRSLRLNPLWLATGSGKKYPWRTSGFEPEDAARITERTSFLDGFAVIRDRYAADWDLSDADPTRALAINSAEGVTINPAELVLAENDLAPPTSKRYLRLVPVTRINNWEQLRVRLRRATADAGSKAALARLFGVTTQAVSQWLSGASAPTADTTLRLLEWVTAEEATSTQKKRAGSADTRPALKTRKANPLGHEKAKSDRKKK